MSERCRYCGKELDEVLMTCCPDCLLEKVRERERRAISERKAGKKLLEWIGWEETYFANNSLFSKEHNSACRNQLIKIIKEHFSQRKIGG